MKEKLEKININLVPSEHQYICIIINALMNVINAQQEQIDLINYTMVKLVEKDGEIYK